jgi:hypothetical protein
MPRDKKQPPPPKRSSVIAGKEKAEARALMLKDLEKSGLDGEDVKKLPFEPCTAKECAALELDRAEAGYKIPYFDRVGKPVEYTDKDGTQKEFFRYRYFKVEEVRGKKQRKYDQPKGSPVVPYYPQTTIEWQSVAGDEEQEIVITEGEKKAAYLCKNGVAGIGLGGI